MSTEPTEGSVGQLAVVGRPVDPSVPVNRGPVTGVRIISHAVIWSVVLVPVLVRMARGWRAVWDDAYISLHAYQVFSHHSPLVGVWSSSSVASGRSYHDLGPLLFWLLAVPVHIDPTQGALWGAALWCGVILSAAAEAAWSVRGWPACGAVAMGAAVLLWVEPGVFARTVWNPYAGLVFLFASIVLAWCVSSGSLRWWPVLVFAGSVTMQSHLVYVANASLLIVLAPVLGVLVHRQQQGLRWLIGGLVVGAFCWWAPVVQQLTGNPGNLTLLLQSNSNQPKLGIGVGLRLVGDAGSVPPVWLSHFPAPDSLSAFAGFQAFVYGHSALEGVLVLLVTGGVTAWAWASGRRSLGALGILVVVSSLSLVLSFALVPTGSFLVLGYLLMYVWVVGIALWCFLLWAAFEGLPLVVRRLTGDRSPPRLGFLRSTAPTIGLVIIAATAVVVGATLPGNQALAVDTNGNRQVHELTAAVERRVPKGPVRFVLLPDSLSVNTRGTDETGTDWQLTADGWQTGLPLALTQQNGYDPPRLSWPTVAVTLHADGTVTAVRLR